MHIMPVSSHMYTCLAMEPSQACENFSGARFRRNKSIVYLTKPTSGAFFYKLLPKRKSCLQSQRPRVLPVMLQSLGCHAGFLARERVSTSSGSRYRQVNVSMVNEIVRMQSESSVDGMIKNV